MNTRDQSQSVYRERLFEHLLIGQLLKHAWLHDDSCLEVARGEIDRSGYDLVLEARGVIRHVQLKTSSKDSKTARQNVHVGLGCKPSGCVVWSVFDAETLDIGSFLFFGGAAGEPLPSLSPFSIAKHTKGNASGIKTGRPNLRVLPKARFERIGSLGELYSRLFKIQ